ncbi:uncharacterized protein G2W53_028480 [Senna tora]|uniref:Uncharacterized protein n=1 Tax=Senna tora TaxID=362788 RepID=A0A834T3B9_9FABA|nr:uncharacterized protein G2W53_028480 [Senna tora]
MLSFKFRLLVAAAAAGASVGGGGCLAFNMEMFSSEGLGRRFECGIDVGGINGSKDVVMMVSEREGSGLMTRRPGPRRKPWLRCVLEKRWKEVLYNV